MPTREELQATLREGLTLCMPELLGPLAIVLGEPIGTLSPRQYELVAGELAPLFERMLIDLSGFEREPTAEDIVRLINDWLRLDPAVPLDVNPLEYYVDLARNLAGPHVGWRGRLPERGLQLFDAFHDFVEGVIRAHGLDPVMSLSQEAFLTNFGSSLAPQFGRMRTNFPPVAFNGYHGATGEQADRLLRAWMTVAADWDQLTRFALSLLRLAQGRPIGWVETADVKLRDRANALPQVPNLAEIAPLQWVTIRNALAHGSAYFDPNSRD